MPSTWIVVADSARARVFARHEGGLRERYNLTHPESQLHDRDLRTGGKGEVNKSAGTGSHQSDPAETTMEKHAELFAKELADFLKQARVKGTTASWCWSRNPRCWGACATTWTAPPPRR